MNEDITFPSRQSPRPSSTAPSLSTPASRVRPSEGGEKSDAAMEVGGTPLRRGEGALNILNIQAVEKKDKLAIVFQLISIIEMHTNQNMAILGLFPLLLHNSWFYTSLDLGVIRMLS